MLREIQIIYESSQTKTVAKSNGNIIYKREINRGSQNLKDFRNHI